MTLTMYIHFIRVLQVLKVYSTRAIVLHHAEPQSSISVNFRLLLIDHGSWCGDPSKLTVLYVPVHERS